MEAAIDRRGRLIPACLASRLEGHRCPGCHRDVVLRHGMRRAAHFAHRRPQVDRTCPYFLSIDGSGGQVLHLSSDRGFLVDVNGRRFPLDRPRLFRRAEDTWYVLQPGHTVIPGREYLLFSPSRSLVPGNAVPERNGFWLVAMPEVVPAELVLLLSAHRLTIHHPAIVLEPNRRQSRLGEPVILTIVTRGVLEPEEGHFHLEISHGGWTTRYRRVDLVGLWPTFEFVGRRAGSFVIHDAADRIRPLRIDVDPSSTGLGERPFDLVQAA